MTIIKTGGTDVSIERLDSGEFVLSISWLEGDESRKVYLDENAELTEYLEKAFKYDHEADAVGDVDGFGIEWRLSQVPKAAFVLVANPLSDQLPETYFAEDQSEGVTTPSLEKAKRYPSEEKALEDRLALRQAYDMDIVVYIDALEVPDVIASIVEHSHGGTEPWYVIRFVHPTSRGGDDEWVKFYGGALAWDTLEASETFETQKEAIDHAKLLAEASMPYDFFINAKPEVMFKLMILGDYLDSTFQSIRVSFKEGMVIQILKVTPTEAGWNWEMVWGEPYEWVYPGETEQPSGEEEVESDEDETD